MKTAIYTLIITAIMVFNAQAEDINLVADEQVEWHQKEQKMVAIGNAVATKKDMSIRSDTMTAFYGKDKNGKTAINNVHAEGKVLMKSPKADAKGNTLDYDLQADTMILRGMPAQIKTATQTISASDNITYYPSLQKAIALGEVLAVDKENKIYSDKMISFFEKDKSGNLEMNKVEIYGHVKIVNPKATVTSKRGLYLPKEGLVKLYEEVTIDQEGNKLNGDYAETNLNTGISKLISNKSKRVHGIFKEKSSTSKSKK